MTRFRSTQEDHVIRVDNIRPPMGSNVIREHCPACGATEIDDTATPRTQYACGSSDYDQRPGTWAQGGACADKVGPRRLS